MAMAGFIKTTDHRPTNNRPTDPPTHRPTDTPTHRPTDHFPLTHRPTDHLPTDSPTGRHQFMLKQKIRF